MLKFLKEAEELIKNDKRVSFNLSNNISDGFDTDSLDENFQVIVDYHKSIEELFPELLANRSDAKLYFDVHVRNDAQNLFTWLYLRKLSKYAAEHAKSSEKRIKPDWCIEYVGKSHLDWLEHHLGCNGTPYYLYELQQKEPKAVNLLVAAVEERVMTEVLAYIWVYILGKDQRLRPKKHELPAGLVKFYDTDATERIPAYKKFNRNYAKLGKRFEALLKE
jgi:hypothetical protein